MPAPRPSGGCYRRLGRICAWLAGLAVLGTAGFVGLKARSVAQELVAPPFYQPQSLLRVDATFQDLARGAGNDPGGTWEVREMGSQRVWLLHRRIPSRGVVLLLHGFGDDRWGTSPAVRWFPDLDGAIFTYLRRDEAIREGRTPPPVTLGAREAEEVVAIVHGLEASGVPRGRVLLMGRSLGASVGLLALARLEREGKGPLAGIIWEGAPASSRDFAERLVRGAKDQAWHPWLAPLIGSLASRMAARKGAYRIEDTDLLARTQGLTLATPGLCFLATQDRLAPPPVQRQVAARFARCQVVEVNTWHLQCSEVLKGNYALAIRAATRAWLDPAASPLP